MKEPGLLHVSKLRAKTQSGGKLMRTFMGVCALFVLAIPAVLAQTAEVSAKPLTDADIQLIRSDVQADKNQIITDTMAFNDLESAAFWPIYRDYARDQQVIGDDRWRLIKTYAEQYDSLDDAKAKELAQQMFDIDAKTVKLRQDYWPRFEKALGAKRAAKFYQVDNRLSLIINLKLTSEIPLIQ
jgi:hypothetical protein